MTERDDPDSWLNQQFIKRGAVVVAPVIVTLYIVFWLVQRIEAIPGMALLELTAYDPVNRLLQLAVFLVGGAFLVAFTGYLTGTAPGLKIEKLLDRFVEKIPFLGRVYSLTKKTADTALRGSDRLTDPVKLELNGARFTAYRTSNSTEDGREVVFLPTSPNVTSGYPIEVAPEEIIEPEEPADKILRRTFSAGFGEEDEDEEMPRRDT